MEQKELKNSWEKELRNYLKAKFKGILARKKWDKGDIEDVLDCIKEFLKSEEEKNYQRFIEILEELNEFVETESGKSGRKEILQKIQEVIKQLKDEK